MIELSKEERGYLIPLCEGKKNVDLWSCIEGHMGKAWVNSKEEPTMGIVLVADFCHFLGTIKSHEEEVMVKALLDQCKGRIIIANDASWVKVVEKYYPEDFKRFNRYSIKRDPVGFDEEVLKKYITFVEEDYEIERIDETLYYKVLEDPFMADCCSNFSSLEEFLKHGIGYGILHNGVIIAAASSYSFCKGYIDITIGTRDEYRQKGLAKACASKVILECLDKNIYPVWDAVDMRSIALAEKLGYCFDKEYEVYYIKK